MRQPRSSMQLVLVDSFQAVQGNVRALGLYLLFVVPIASLVTSARLYFPKPDDATTYQAALYSLLELLYLLALIGVTSTGQALAFSRMAASLDRPLWRHPGDPAAIRRYFALWACLNGAVILLGKSTYILYTQGCSDSVVASVLFIADLASIIAVPIGAACMFAGRMDFPSVGESLGALGRQWTKSLILFLFSAFLFNVCWQLLGVVHDQETKGAIAVSLLQRSAVDVASSYFDCLVFAATFLICRADRDTPRDTAVDF